MNRDDLISKIANRLLEEELLNEADCNSIDVLLKDVKDIIEHELKDYILLVGQVF